MPQWSRWSSPYNTYAFSLPLTSWVQPVSSSILSILLAPWCKKFRRICSTCLECIPPCLLWASRLSTSSITSLPYLCTSPLVWSVVSGPLACSSPWWLENPPFVGPVVSIGRCWVHQSAAYTPLPSRVLGPATSNALPVDHWRSRITWLHTIVSSPLWFWNLPYLSQISLRHVKALQKCMYFSC